MCWLERTQATSRLYRPSGRFRSRSRELRTRWSHKSSRPADRVHNGAGQAPLVEDVESRLGSPPAGHLLELPSDDQDTPAKYASANRRPASRADHHGCRKEPPGGRGADGLGYAPQSRMEEDHRNRADRRGAKALPEALRCGGARSRRRRNSRERSEGGPCCFCARRQLTGTPYLDLACHNLRNKRSTADRLHPRRTAPQPARRSSRTEGGSQL